MTVVNVVVTICYGGVASVVQELIKQQNINNDKSYVISIDAPEKIHQLKETKNIDFEFIRVKSKLARKFQTLFGIGVKKEIEKIIKSNDDVVVHYHNPIGVGLLGHIFPNSVLTLHGKLAKTGKIANFLFYGTLSRVIKGKTVLVGCSKETAQYYEDMLHAPFRFVQNGVSLPSETNNAYGMNAESFNVVFASTLIEDKGWDVLFDAFLDLPAEIQSKAELYFCGSADEDVKNKLSEACKENDRIHYLGYIKNVKEAVIPFASVVVLPSVMEGLPMILLEAISEGKPIIATPVGGIPEIIDDGETGLFCTRDSKSVKEKLIELISNPEKCRIISQNAKEKYERCFSSQKMYEEYKKIYDEIVETRRK